MQLACNYYEETERLAREGKICVDCFKYPSLGFQMKVFDDPRLREYAALSERLRDLGPLLLHGLGQRDNDIGRADFKERFDPEFTGRILELSGIRGVSLHLCGGDTALPEEERRRIIVDNIRYLREALGPLEFLSLENVDGNPYSDKTYSDCCVDPHFIRETVEAADTEFLLDISHAYGAALARGMDVRDYIDGLPLDRLYEVHINGWIRNERGLMAHTAIRQEGYELLEEVLSRTSPRIVTLEYGRGDDRLGIGIPLLKPGLCNERAMEEIAEQMERLQNLIKRYKFETEA